MNQPQATHAPRQANPTMPEPQVVQAKISYMPLIATTILTTGVALGVGYLFSRWTAKKKSDDEEKAEREREDRAGMMPPMPMMWPGASSLSAANPSAAPSPVAVAPSAPSETQTQLNDIVERLGAWQENLEAREQHLSLVGEA